MGRTYLTNPDLDIAFGQLDKEGGKSQCSKYRVFRFGNGIEFGALF